MEKNQQKTGERPVGAESEKAGSGGRPGQQLPAQAEEREAPKAEEPGPERHSESSFPHADEETLGTP